MDELKIIPCQKCGTTSLLKLDGSGGLVAVWSDCACLSKNKILSQLREEGFNIGSHYFKKKSKKENQPPVNDLLLGKFDGVESLEASFRSLAARLLGKFDGVESLESALRSLAAHMDIPEQELEQQIGKLGLPTAYQRLQAAFSGRKQKANI